MRLNEAYEKFGDQIDFYCIYVREAHPSDGWEMFENIDAGISQKTPTNVETTVKTRAFQSSRSGVR